MATRSTYAWPTKSAIARADNAQLLALHRLVSRDIRRRIENYVRGPNVAEIVLDGIHFVGNVRKVNQALTCGTGMAFGEGTWESTLFHAPQSLQEKLTRSTLANDYGASDEDDADDADDAEEDHDA